MEFVFRRHDNVGSAAAEEDSDFLDDCFVDTGDIDLLLDCKSPKSIIVGRTGVGKSALIYRLSSLNRNVTKLSPHDLSLNFIATNKVITFFESAGVNLTPFYVLLWKHLLVVELLKSRFDIVNESSHSDFMRKMKSIIHKKDRYKDLALDYLEQWGDKFWLTTEQRIHELTNRVEKNLSGGVEGKLSGVTFSAEGARKLTTEQREEVVEHGLDAVSKVQIRELDNMLAVLNDNVFDDTKEPYYITIDMLDEDWADDRIKYKLIRALIDTVRRFRSVTNVKVILALRQDLLFKVIHLEAAPGFQEEKYKSLYLTLQWNKSALTQLVDLRINQLIKPRYTKGEVSFSNVFPKQIDGVDTWEYMLARTFYRPRDIIVFLNECLELATGRPDVSAHIIKVAEEHYSYERLQSLAHEWSSILPNFIFSARLFCGCKDHFPVSDITEDFIDKWYSDISQEISDFQIDPITRSVNNLYSENGNFGPIRNFILRQFFSTGLIGIKTGPTDTIAWCRTGSISVSSIRPNSTIYIHPMFFRALGIKYAR